MSALKKTATDVQVDNIKKRNSILRSSVYANAEYESSSASVPVVSQDMKDSLLRTPKSKNPVGIVDRKLRYTKDGKLRSRFSDVKFSPNESIFEDHAIVSSHYFGFYILAWITVALIFFNTLIHYHLEKGSILQSPIMKILQRDLWKVGLTDLAMYLALYLTFSIQLLVKYGAIDWCKSGWIIQSVVEFSVLFFFIWFSDYQRFPWVGKVFLCLHGLVLLMKSHSYAFYNGYFWRIKEELGISIKYLQKHRDDLDEETGKLLKESIEFCEFELSQHTQENRFPSNINLKNFFEYTMFPTVVYEISYPRTERIRWSYVFTKVCGIFGIICIMIIIAQNHIFPQYDNLTALRSLPFLEKLRRYPLLVCDLVPPFLALYLLVWFLIWELILNAIAELSRFGDREFYGDWWNCVSWDEFARLWNIPVHKFLLRHVYHSSISVLKLSKLNATFFTFLLSSIIHELVMFVIFGKFRGYLLFLQMCQLPLVSISRSKFMRNRKVLGNVVFWIGITTGPSLMCSLYLTF